MVEKLSTDSEGSLQAKRLSQAITAYWLIAVFNEHRLKTSFKFGWKKSQQDFGPRLDPPPAESLASLRVIPLVDHFVRS
jgi:hypothetical protein